MRMIACVTAEQKAAGAIPVLIVTSDPTILSIIDDLRGYPDTHVIQCEAATKKHLAVLAPALPTQGLVTIEEAPDEFTSVHANREISHAPVVPRVFGRQIPPRHLRRPPQALRGRN